MTPASGMVKRFRGVFAMGVLVRTDALRASAKTLQALLNEDDPAVFPKLTDEQMGLLTPLGQIRPTEVGEVLFREGDTAYDVMVLLEGRVAVVLGSGESERELVIHRPRDLMIELNLLTGQRVHATGGVREAGSILSVPAQEFRALLGRELVFGDFVLQMLFRRRQAIERLVMGIQIVGSRFDRNTHRLREFAARNRVLHNWLDCDSVHGKRLVEELSIDIFSGPIVFLEGGTFLRNPTKRRAGQSHRPAAGLRVGREGLRPGNSGRRTRGPCSERLWRLRRNANCNDRCRGCRRAGGNFRTDRELPGLSGGDIGRRASRAGEDTG
jgi:cAMP-binding proteins - catabolite gene activator and regulatory subunit of cAMP-dependent protein kinases